MGSIFPSSSSAALCLTKIKPISNTELSHLKNGILDFLKTHDEAFISELADNLEVEPKKIVLAIRELKDDGLLI